LCKACCRTKCYLENRDCAGHRILIKTRREKAREYAALEQCSAESQSHRARDHQTTHCKHIIANKETQNNSNLDKINWEHAVQAELASEVRQEQCCQSEKEQKMTNKQDVIPILKFESMKNRTNISLMNSKECQNDVETVNHIPQYKNS
jgi:hypothetical protein